MKKLALSILMTAYVMVAMADSYHDTFQEYMNTCSLADEHLKETCSQSMMQMSLISPDTMLAEAIQKYNEQQMLKDIQEVMEPYFRTNVTEYELRTIMEWEAAHPRYALICQEDDSIMKSPAGDTLTGNIVEGLSEVMFGQRVPRVEKDTRISKHYEKTFNTYYQHSVEKQNMELIAEHTKSDMASIYDDTNAKMKVKELKQLTKNLKSYIADTYRITLMNYYFQHGRTEEDFRLQTELNTMQAFISAHKAVVAVMVDNLAFSRQILTRFVDWAEPAYPSTISAVRLGMQWAAEGETTITEE